MLLRKWLNIKPVEIQIVFCAIHYGRCEDHAISDRSVNDTIKCSVVKVKWFKWPSDLEVSRAIHPASAPLRTCQSQVTNSLPSCALMVGQIQI